MAAIANPSSSSTQLPLLPDQNDSQFSTSLHRLETFLGFFGFCQYSFFGLSLSWVSFLLLGIALPVLIIQFSPCSDNCERYEIRRFEVQVLVFQSLCAVASLLCIFHNLRKHGLRKFLFVDRCQGHLAQFHDDYAKKISNFFKLLILWVLPCLLVKIVREVVLILHIHHFSWWQSIVVLTALIVSWTCTTVIYLSGCALFNLVCNLQVIHFENYGKLLETDLDIAMYIEEHIRLTHCLSKISHRFRIFFIIELLVVTASQFVSLLQTTVNHGIVNLINGGNFAIASIVELVGIIICLHSAAKITHRAQGVASVATKWHSLVTCASNDPSLVGIVSNGASSEAVNKTSLLPITYSETDLESVDYVPVPTNSQLASYMSSYHKRHAFVMYLQSNPGGFTVFGWTIDRALISTIFFLEMSLVLFVLGKTITFSSLTSATVPT